jgi:diguanylate cyclase (GGDEF)-like protein
VCGASLVALGKVAIGGGQAWRVALDTLAGKRIMLIGNIAVGLLIVALIDAEQPWWLILLPPALWVLHQTYTYRVRGDDERRTWQVFAEATRELNRLDLEDAAVAGIRGALRLFPAQSAQLLVVGEPGTERCYQGEAGGGVTACPPAALDGDRHLTAHSLVVGGTRVGDLRLRMHPGEKLHRRDLLMFNAYGDALAAALHDAVTHHELREMAARTSHDASHDPVTKLPNRAGFLARGDTVLRELRGGSVVALLLLDIDHFKEVNDTLGHAAGDEVLCIAGQRLAAALTPSELPARLGGDEFAVLISPVTDNGLASARASADLVGAEYPAQLAHVLNRARRLAEELAAPSEVAGVKIAVEASVGVVLATAGAVDLTELLRRADVAMYQAKRGGSSVAWYDAGRDPASTDRLALLAEFREALAVRDQLVLLIQPTVSLTGHGATGAEALVRWQHPRRGELKPAEFVKVVEHSELIGQFTRYVIARALEISAGWAAEGLDVPIAVNVSPRGLLDARLPDDVRALLTKHGVRPHRLVLEITETVVMSELAVIDDVLKRLRDLGVQLAVDDFGTGYSSLTFLTRVQVDEVKVDRRFVRRMVDSPEVAAIVRTTVDLARVLGLRVVAEGVETAEQRVALASLGCSAAQGFHFYKPMSPARAGEVLRRLGPAEDEGERLRAEGAS